MIKTLAIVSIAATIVSATAAFAAPVRHIVHGQANVNTTFRHSAHSEYRAFLLVNIYTKEAPARIRWGVAQATHSPTAARAHAAAANKMRASQVGLSR
jgi:hypothetical protein